MEAGITDGYVYSDENDAFFTSVEAGITKVITATYPVMLAVLSSSCNEQTRTYSEQFATCMATYLAIDIVVCIYFYYYCYCVNINTCTIELIIIITRIYMAP